MSATKRGIGDRIGKVIVGIVVGLIVLSFAVWGMEDVVGPGANSKVVSVGDEGVDSNEFQRVFRRELNRLNRERATRGEPGLTADQAFAQGFHRQVLGQMLEVKITDLDARELGLGVDPELARNVIDELGDFRDPITGELDVVSLDQRLGSLGYTRKDFEDDIIDGIRRQQIVPAVVDGVVVPDIYAEQRFAFANEQRAADMITLTAKEVEVPADPDEATLSAWIEENSRLYTAPEFRRFELLRFEPSDIIPDIEVTDEEVREHYEFLLRLNPGTDGAISSPETRSYAFIKADDEEQAKQVAARMAAGEAPATVASSLGLEAATVLTDALPGEALDPNVDATAFDLPEGEAAAVLGSLPFWYAVHVSGVTPAVEPTLDDIREDVVEDKKNDLAQRQLAEIVSEVRQAMNRNQTFEQIAREQGVVLQTYDFLDRSGQTEDGLFLGGFQSRPGVGGDDEIMKEVFVSDIGYESDILDTETEGYFAVNVLDVKEAKLKPLAEIRETATADWKTAQVDDALQALAVDVTSRLRGDEEIADVAAELGVEVETVVLNRTARNPKLSDPLASELLRGEVGTVARSEGVQPLTRQVAVLSRIVETGDRLVGSFADAFREQERNAVAADINAAYRQAIIAENPIEENMERARTALGIEAQ